MAVANQYGIDLASIQQGWDNSVGNALRTMVMGKQLKQMDREEETQGILDENTSAALGGDSAALGKITARKPELGTALMTRLASLDKDARERTLKEAPVVARMLGQVTDQNSYSRAIEGMSSAGISVKGLPMRYDPNFVNPRLMAARAMVDPKFHFQETATGLAAIDQNDPNLTPRMIPGMTPKPDTEIGKLIVARDKLRPGDPSRAMFDAAIKKATALPKGTRVQLADGTEIEVGGYGDGESPGLGKPAINNLEETAIKASTQLARLGQIERGYKPEYQQIATRGVNWWNSVKAKAGVDLDQDSRKQLQEYTTYRRDSVSNLNQTIKDITGAAMSIPEAERIGLEVPNAGTGVFDGDSPPEFEAKLKGATAAARNALLRANWARAKGMDPLKTGVSLEEVPAMVEKRGAAIEKKVREANPGADDEAVKQTVRITLGKEFGMYR